RSNPRRASACPTKSCQKLVWQSLGGKRPEGSGHEAPELAARSCRRPQLRRVRSRNWGRMPPKDRWARIWQEIGTRARATELALRLDDDRHFRRDTGEDLDRDLVRAERLERLLEIDPVPTDRDPSPALSVGDVPGRERA